MEGFGEEITRPIYDPHIFRHSGKRQNLNYVDLFLPAKNYELDKRKFFELLRNRYIIWILAFARMTTTGLG